MKTREKSSETVFWEYFTCFCFFFLKVNNSSVWSIPFLFSFLSVKQFHLPKNTHSNSSFLYSFENSWVTTVVGLSLWGNIRAITLQLKPRKSGSPEKAELPLVAVLGISLGFPRVGVPNGQLGPSVNTRDAQDRQFRWGDKIWELM